MGLGAGKFHAEFKRNLAARAMIERPSCRFRWRLQVTFNGAGQGMKNGDDAKHDDDIDADFDLQEYSQAELDKIFRLLNWWSLAQIAFWVIITLFALSLMLIVEGG